jgi:hypothetical protein
MQSNVSNEEGKRRNYILVSMPDINDGQPRFWQRQPGQPGSFFSIHSTNQQPISCVYDLSKKETKCCLCCSVTTASIQERWSPYKPGMYDFVIYDHDVILPFAYQARIN